MKCWWCGGDLRETPLGKVIFGIFKDALGHEHKVHKSCVDRCKEDHVTAQPTGSVNIMCHGTYRKESGIPLENDFN